MIFKKTATEKLLKSMGLKKSFIQTMKEKGVFRECNSGFVWLRDKGDHYHLMSECIIHPWPVDFKKMLLKLKKEWDKDVIGKSDDPNVIDFCLKTGAEKLSDTKVIWRLKDV